MYLNLPENSIQIPSKKNFPMRVPLSFVKRIQKLTNIPVCSGFGFKSPEDAKKVANSGCNGVIVGSTFVKYIQDNLGAPDLTQSFGKQVKSFSEVLK